MTRRSAMVRAEVERLCRKFPLYPDSRESDRRASSAPADALAAVRCRTFEPRAGQVAHGRPRRARASNDGGVLLAEAGTGTGKTLAYLVPAILSRQRVLISTGTKNLQEQIYFKDIPALRAALDVPFTATYMKGRANYLCLHRLDQLNEGGGPAIARRLPADHPRVVGADRHRRSRRARGSAGGSAVLERGVGDRRDLPRHASVRATTTASSRGCASARPSPTSSSSIIICCAPTPRSGRTPTAK